MSELPLSLEFRILIKNLDMAKIVIKSEKTHILVDFSHKDVNFPC